MIYIQKGFKNEKDFAKVLDKKEFKQLKANFQDLLKAIFKDIKEEDIVECWTSRYFEKADIKIKVNKEVKGISIKTGKYCSMHQENIESLNPFLRKIGVEERIIKKLKDFLIGKVQEQRVDEVTYIFHNYNDIKEIKETLNNYYIKLNLILRFLFQGTEKQKYGCDAIIHGTPEDFIWATKEEILEYLLNYKKDHEIYLKFSTLNLKSYDRNLRNDEKRKVKQNDIQIKWYSIKNDLENIIKNRENNKNDIINTNY